MALRVKGNPAAHLRRIALAIRSCPKSVRADAARRAKVRAEARIDLQFAQGRGPDGKRWPLPKDGHRPAMIRTGALRAGYVVAVVAAGSGLSLTIGSRQHYAEYLQRGTERMLPRKQVPDVALPDEWAEDLRASYQEAHDLWYSRLKA